MNVHELVLLLTAKDGASATLKQIARVLASEVVTGLGNAAQAAAEDEASMLRLEQSVINAKQSFEEFEPAIAERIKLGQELAFGDSETRDALSNLVSMTKDVNKALDLESLAMDVARGRNIDLATASELVGKVSQGNTGILSRYGIEIHGVVTPQKALAELQARYADQAVVYGESTSGAIDRIKDSIAEWKEGIGAALGPAQGFIALLPGLETGVAGVAAAFGVASPALKALFLWIKADAIPTLAALDIALAPLLIAVGVVAGALGLGIMAGNAVGDMMGLPPLQVGVPGFAAGGVVPGPMGMPQLAVVHGGEEVLRSDQRSSRNGGDGDTHFHFNAPVYGLEDFRRQVQDAVTSTARGGGFRGVPIG